MPPALQVSKCFGGPFSLTKKIRPEAKKVLHGSDQWFLNERSWNKGEMKTRYHSTSMCFGTNSTVNCFSANYTLWTWHFATITVEKWLMRIDYTRHISIMIISVSGASCNTFLNVHYTRWFLGAVRFVGLYKKVKYSTMLRDYCSTRTYCQ